MTCVSKEYEIKTKMVQGVTTAKNDVFFGLYIFFSGGGWEIDFWWEENKKLVVGA